MKSQINMKTILVQKIHKNLPVKADGSKERAEEDAGIRVALSGKEWQPAGALLYSLSRSLVAQQVGHPHGVIANILAQGHA